MTMTPEQATGYIFDVADAYRAEFNTWRIVQLGGSAWTVINDRRPLLPVAPEPIPISSVMDELKHLELRSKQACDDYIHQCALLAAIAAYEGLR